MILEKLRERKRFTNSEKLIAEYVLKHPEQLYQLSISGRIRKRNLYE